MKTKKITQNKEFQIRLPDDIKIIDETKIEFTDDEFVGILCWLKYFNQHYREYGKTTLPEIMFPIISKRIRLDFGLYITKSNCEPGKGEYNIYISGNEKNYSFGRKTMANFIRTWDL